MTAPAPSTDYEPGLGTIEVFPLDVGEETLRRLLTDIFENHWREIQFGVMIQGSVFEIRAPRAPRSGMLDGYLTIDFGDWHLHLCIGEHKGSRANPCPPELAKHRRTARAELYRCLDGACAAMSWGLRLFNGKDEQQLTVFLPNPFLSDDDRIEKEPDWSRLALWDYLRREYLDLDPDPRDRAAAAFVHH